jgi:hypothetical protein
MAKKIKGRLVSKSKLFGCMFIFYASLIYYTRLKVIENVNNFTPTPILDKAWLFTKSEP